MFFFIFFNFNFSVVIVYAFVTFISSFYIKLYFLLISLLIVVLQLKPFCSVFILFFLFIFLP